jgi:hypothetical protein
MLRRDAGQDGGVDRAASAILWRPTVSARSDGIWDLRDNAACRTKALSVHVLQDSILGHKAAAAGQTKLYGSPCRRGVLFRSRAAIGLKVLRPVLLLQICSAIHVTDTYNDQRLKALRNYAHLPRNAARDCSRTVGKGHCPSASGA